MPETNDKSPRHKYCLTGGKKPRCRGSGTDKKDPAWLKLLVESNKPGLVAYMTNRKKMLPEHVNPKTNTMESSQLRVCASSVEPRWRRSKTSDERPN